jgi:hypothetical protein
MVRDMWLNALLAYTSLCGDPYHIFYISEIPDGTCWTVTLQQPAAVQAKAASGAFVKGMHLFPAKVTVPAQGLWYTLETNI